MPHPRRRKLERGDQMHHVHAPYPVSRRVSSIQELNEFLSVKENVELQPEAPLIHLSANVSDNVAVPAVSKKRLEQGSEHVWPGGWITVTQKRGVSSNVETRCASLGLCGGSSAVDDRL